MSLPPPITLVLTAADSGAFAQLSGDFNPLHVDAVAARRLQFGGTVCHGIHLVMLALDRAVAAGALVPAGITSIGAVFGASVRTGTPWQLTLAREDDAGRLRLSASAEGRALFTARLTLAAAPLAAGPQPAEAAPEAPSLPLCPDFPPPQPMPTLAGQVPLRLNTPLLQRLFPALAAQAQGPQIAADLLATTRIVGMACPGLHSIFAEFKLKRRDTGVPPVAGEMPYAVQRADPRFRSVRIGVTGATLDGTLEAFFRAPPVAQPALAPLCAQVAPDRFAGQNALVVGGSRGLGELAAKLLLAGGARVTLSYASGRDDAERICAEAAALGRACCAVPIDVRQPLPAALAQQIAAAGFTHLYHFATPQIAKTPASGWSARLFDDFCRFYLHSLAELVATIATGASRAAPLQLLYPSTVFLDAPEKGFAEYCAAKAAGEVAAEHLAVLHGAHLHKPRLPRLQTDQNSSFLGVEGSAPLPVLRALLQAMHPGAPQRPAGAAA